ncbi:glycoside hydrolase family 10 protein [Haloferula sargassicola]|uniref:Glycosyl hydrolase-like 10 domain-containing protein n=1 Tax=Haloferula sargassicola TaxID=490096 RepID=A0ABP9UT13_9BACT
MPTRLLLLFLCLTALLSAQTYRPVRERPPMPPREFRGAWVAVVYNIDWPSAKGLSAGTQQEQAVAILNKMAAMNMNAVILQVRSHCDAVYASNKEPWSPWLTGTMGRGPGYDPLEFWVKEAHRRGIEVHAWFNPFRALSNVSQQACPNHVSKASPGITKRYGTLLWCDPAVPETRQRAMSAILDVVRRYDVDGVHLDDYFYPYPEDGRAFADGRSPAQRRGIVDGFVRDLYSQVKGAKPWVRVGISPFGIYRPGVPAGIEAGLDAYEQLGCDARKWLANGWVDYLAPQLYWRDQPRKQSFSALLGWWREQGSRPVWPGIAVSRVSSSEDPGRPASEITRQVGLSRTIGPRNWVGHIQWSMKALSQNRGGVSDLLSKGAYSEPALVPPMPWMGKKSVAPVSAQASADGETLKIRWRTGDGSSSKVAVMGRNGRTWHMLAVRRAAAGGLDFRLSGRQPPEAISVSAVDRFGNLSVPAVLAR